MRLTVPIVLLALAVAGVSGCASARAQGPATAEALVVPPVPPRVIVPDIEEIVPAADDPAASRPAAPKPETPAKPPEKPTEPPKPGQVEPPPATPEPAPRVRTPNTANAEQAESNVRSIMARAQALLRGVDYRGLSAAARQQYDTANRFIAQADRALGIRNYVFARNLADKAETLARQLGK